MPQSSHPEPRTFDFGTTRIAWVEIPGEGRSSRREREIAATAQCVAALLGPGAAIAHGPEGEPLIEGWHVSVTHSQRLAAVAIDPARPIGIDAEEWRPVLLKVRRKFLTPSEMDWMPDRQLLHAWTAKEAAFKAAAQPRLLLSGIELAPDLATAAAPATTLRIDYIDLSPTLLAIATPK